MADVFLEREDLMSCTWRGNIQFAAPELRWLPAAFVGRPVQFNTDETGPHC
jgi:hypothetical protein